MLRSLCRDEENVMLMRTLRVFVLSCALACATLLLRAQDGVGGARFDGIRYAPQFQTGFRRALSTARYQMQGLHAGGRRFFHAAGTRLSQPHIGARTEREPGGELLP